MEENNVTIEWGQRLPISESQNTVTEEFSSPEKAEDEYRSRINKQINRRGYENTIPSVKPFRFVGPYWKTSSVIEANAGFADAKKLKIGDHLYVVN